MIGRLTHAPVFREPSKRRVLILVLVALCAVLTLFPERKRAAMSLTPEAPPSLSISSGMSQLGALNSVFGNQSTVEVALKIAASPSVRNAVAEKLKLNQRLDMDRIHVLRWLDRKVDVRSMRGGIIQFEIQYGDGKLGSEIVAAYGEAVSAKLATISRNQATFKRDILVNIVADASERLQKAQTDYDNFRLQTRYGQPLAAITAIGERIPVLEQMIKSKQVELAAQRQFATDDNMRVRQILAELEALQAQLDEAKSIAPDKVDSVGQVVKESTRGERLRRDLLFAQVLHETYRRFLQSTAAEDMTSNINVRVLEPAYVDPARQYNYAPLMMGVLLVLLGIAIEFYTLRPPLQDRKLT
ncbi:hypothetical protein KRR38_20680 [Novosphingobium sp. G106]|uniref:hypothetical protein n=1 Tax=Novosphingobium sp. G106 TaxID=2849500 RepID=UPI001C2CDD03|nr:hypothetical protein [Novosphingobium sp. G106]MBV1690034.1 hypothetical protein [Novosphingobium sp. G106]